MKVLYGFFKQISVNVMGCFGIKNSRGCGRLGKIYDDDGRI